MNEDYDALKQENAELRERLAKAEAEATRYRATANDLMDSIFPFVPPTEEELREMMEPDQGESLSEIMGAYRRELEGRA